MSSRLKTISLLCIAVTSLVAGGWLVCWYVGKSQRGEAEITSFYNSVKLGMTRKDVDLAYAAGGFRTLRLRDISQSILLAQTPIQWGAANWVMWLEFSGGRLAAVRIRYHDSRAVKPKHAPPDKSVSALTQ